MKSEKSFAYIRNHKVAGFFILWMAMSILGGCTVNKKSVKLHSDQEMQEMMEMRYGNAELVDVKAYDEPYMKVFTFRDGDYGFTYEVESSPRAVGMDGSTFYYDGVAAIIKYQEPFLEYFTEKEKDAFENQGITLKDSLVNKEAYPDSRMFCLQERMLLSTTEHLEEDMEFVLSRVTAYKEVPELTQKFSLDVYDSEEGKSYGTVDPSGFVSAESKQIDYFMQQVRELAGIKDIEYLRTEEKKVKDVPELADQNFYNEHYNNGGGTVKLYYFSYEGEEYFIVNAWVAQEGSNGGGIYQYYQNYKHYDVSR